MNLYLLTAGVLATAVAFLHSYLGERYILIRLFRRPDLPHLFGNDVFTKRTLRFAWHLTSIAWLGFAVLLLALASDSAADSSTRTPLIVVQWTFTVSAVYAFGASRGRHLSWVLFLGIAVASWLGSR